MKITVINGTEIKGCTYHIKEAFLSELRSGNEITEFYLPRDLPEFCRGCKTCFFTSELKCLHASYTMPIWNSMLEADLIVFAYPVYALRTPASIKTLLDHFCVHWMVHRPDRKMFAKKAIILTDSIGAPNGAAQRDVKTSLTWMGVSDIKCLGFGLMEGVIWDELSSKRRNKIEKKTVSLAKRCSSRPRIRMNIKVHVFFMMCKALHAAVLKSQTVPSADNQHYIDNGWIKPKK